MGATLQIELDDVDSYHVGGDVLTGKLILSVTHEKLSLRDVKFWIVCDVDMSMTVNTARPDQNPKFKIETSKNRIFEGEMALELHEHHYNVGEHEIPFRIPLPVDKPKLPPSVTNVLEPNTFGHVNYKLKAQAKKGVSSFFSSGSELKASTPFLFMPVDVIDPDNKANTSLREEPFNGLVVPTGKPNKGIFDSLLKRKPKEEQHAFQLRGIFSHPDAGLMQGKPAELTLRIQSENREKIQVKSVALFLESVLILHNNKYKVEYIVQKEPILQKLVLRSGSNIDLSDVLKGNRVPSTLTPTFDTLTMDFRHRIRIELSLAQGENRSPNSSMRFTQTVPVVVLSPFVKPPDVVSSPTLSSPTAASTNAASTAASSPIASSSAAASTTASDSRPAASLNESASTKNDAKLSTESPSEGYKSEKKKHFRDIFSGKHHQHSSSLGDVKASHKPDEPGTPQAGSSSIQATSQAQPASGGPSNEPSHEQPPYMPSHDKLNEQVPQDDPPDYHEATMSN